MATMISFCAPRPDARIGAFYRGVIDAAIVAWKPGDPGERWPLQHAAAVLGAEVRSGITPDADFDTPPAGEDRYLSVREAARAVGIDVFPYRESLPILEIRAEWRAIAPETPESLWENEFERLVRAHLDARNAR